MTDRRADILIAPPTVEPISTADAKANMRVTSSTEDALIARLVKVARGRVEEHCTKALILQSRKLVLDRFPCDYGAPPDVYKDAIELFRGPVRSVQSVQYLDTAGTLQTLAASAYRVDKLSALARITPAYGTIWPYTYDVPAAVLVNYTTGYFAPFTADASTDVLSAAGHGYADTDIVQVSTIGGVLPTGLVTATNYYVRDSAADTLKLSATSGGAAIDITGAGTTPNVLGRMPDELLQAMLLIVGHLFEHREENSDLEVFAMPFNVENLLAPYRLMRF